MEIRIGGIWYPIMAINFATDFIHVMWTTVDGVTQVSAHDYPTFKDIVRFESKME